MITNFVAVLLIQPLSVPVDTCVSGDEGTLALYLEDKGQDASELLPGGTGPSHWENMDTLTYQCIPIPLPKPKEEK